MSIFVLFAGAVALSVVAPKLADTLGGIITFAFLLPFFTFGGGAFLWAVTGIFGMDLPYILCCLVGGLPLGLLVARIIYSD